MAKQKQYYMQEADGRIIATEHPEYWQECEQLSQAKGKRLLAEQSKVRLLELIDKAENKTIYTRVNSVSSSGMSRNIHAWLIVDNEPHSLCNLIADLGFTQTKDGSIKMHGGGMDMGFALVHELSYKLYGGDGYKLKQAWL